MATYNVVEHTESLVSAEKGEISWGRNLSEVGAVSSVAMILDRLRPDKWYRTVRIEITVNHEGKEA